MRVGEKYIVQWAEGRNTRKDEESIRRSYSGGHLCVCSRAIEEAAVFKNRSSEIYPAKKAVL